VRPDNANRGNLVPVLLEIPPCGEGAARLGEVLLSIRPCHHLDRFPGFVLVLAGDRDAEAGTGAERDVAGLA
jgi:hypothetical protein